MLEYHTRYPKTVSMEDGTRERIAVHPQQGVEQLHVVVRERFERMYGIFQDEGFTRVKFEHTQPRQLGRGLSLKLDKPWEMHLRLSEMDGQNILIHAEVEVSRDYMQHLFSQRTPIVYEVVRMLDRNGIESRIWNARTGKYVKTTADDYTVRLATPSLPIFAWKPMVYSIGVVGLFYLVKYLLTI